MGNDYLNGFNNFGGDRTSFHHRWGQQDQERNRLHLASPPAVHVNVETSWAPAPAAPAPVHRRREPEVFSKPSPFVSSYSNLDYVSPAPHLTAAHAAPLSTSRSRSEAVDQWEAAGHVALFALVVAAGLVVFSSCALGGVIVGTLTGVWTYVASWFDLHDFREMKLFSRRARTHTEVEADGWLDGYGLLKAIANEAWDRSKCRADEQLSWFEGKPNPLEKTFQIAACLSTLAVGFTACVLASVFYFTVLLLRIGIVRLAQLTRWDGRKSKPRI